ncbi:hypothetical protein BKA64DRAFT_683884 [Cadophora sp. MPI-SDFR-AT-0126]|nr:hypothetical protein BKA64DRAFT_683884 [Leotiomycetes sp. MPI-SDFR-AT-0126]
MMSSSCDHCIEKCDCSSRDSEPADSSPIPCRPSPCKFTVPVTDYRLLTQTQLSFGNGPTIEECKLCDTRYNPTIPYDVQMHADRHVEAVTFDSDSINFSEVTIGSHGIGLDRLLYIKVTRYDASRVRSFAARVVDKVDGELGVKSENLWGPNQRFQVFIVMLNGQPIGALVAVPIVKAGRYSREYELDEFGPLKEDLSKEVVSTSINMCVDRLWVHPDHRGGITHRVHFAWRLMELAREHFIPNYHIPKCEVAFSYPSNQGYSFACKYFKGAFESDTNLKGKGVKMLVDSDEFVAPAESV